MHIYVYTSIEARYCMHHMITITTITTTITFFSHRFFPVADGDGCLRDSVPLADKARVLLREDTSQRRLLTNKSINPSSKQFDDQSISNLINLFINQKSML